MAVARRSWRPQRSAEAPRPSTAEVLEPVRPDGRAVRVPPGRQRSGRWFFGGLATALLLVPTLAGAIIALGASLVVQTLSETSFRVCLALALYGVAPTVALTAGAALTQVRRGRPFLAGVALGALLLVPAGVALASLIG